MRGIYSFTEVLDSYNNRNREAKDIIWPDGIYQIIFFDIHDQQQFNSLKIPQSIIGIEFGHNFNLDISNIDLPNNLRYATFGSDFEKSLENIKWPESLQILCFCACNKIKINVSDNVELNFITADNRICEMLPNNLKKLSIDNLYSGLTNLPTSLEELKVGHNKCYIEESKIPFGCQVINYL
jgi:hypothetical protein